MKLDILMHYEVDEDTGEIKYIGKEKIVVDTTSKKEVKKGKSSLSNEVPQLKLNANNFELNPLSCELLKVVPGEKVHINYPKQGDKYVPAIGTAESFNINGGNKLTKNLTVAFRGNANKKLAEYGTLFELKESNVAGVYYLVSDTPVETNLGNQDISKDDEIEIYDDFDLDDLDNIDLDESTDISTIDLTL